MKHLFIVNPKAGGRDRTALVSGRAGAYFARKPVSYEVYRTRAPMDAVDKIKREAARNDALRVYACGGDGILNECVNGAAESANVAVGCFPGGTGNDFIKTFEPEKLPFDSLEALIEGEARPVDLMRCNGRYCLNICSVGIDARIGTDVHQYSDLPIVGGRFAYLSSLTANYVKGITDDLRIGCNGQIYSGKFNLVCCCNGQYYGGGFRPAPEARPDDGVLDVLLVRDVSRLVFLPAVFVYARGGHRFLPKYITYLRTRILRIQSDHELCVNIDGEALSAKNLKIELLPGAMSFIYPKKSHR